MFARSRKQMWILCGSLALAALYAGIAAACNGDYCNENVEKCFPLLEWIEDTCCQDPNGDTTFHCMKCTRELYDCGSNTIPGPPFDRHSPGAQCQ